MLRELRVRGARGAHPGAADAWCPPTTAVRVAWADPARVGWPLPAHVVEELVGNAGLGDAGHPWPWADRGGWWQVTRPGSGTLLGWPGETAAEELSTGLGGPLSAVIHRMSPLIHRLDPAGDDLVVSRETPDSRSRDDDQGGGSDTSGTTDGVRTAGDLADAGPTFDDDDDPARPGGRAHRARSTRSPDAAGPGRARTPPGCRGRQPEGWRRQDHLRCQHRRRARPARSAGSVVDLDPQGNASTALGSSTTAACRRPTTRVVEGAPLADVVAAVPRRRRPDGRAGDHRPGRRRDRAGQRRGAREPAAQGDRRPPAGRHRGGRRARSASTTSSSTARPRSGCSRSTRSSRARR